MKIQFKFQPNSNANVKATSIMTKTMLGLSLTMLLGISNVSYGYAAQTSPQHNLKRNLSEAKAQAQAIVQCHVVGVHDGDTLTCLNHHRKTQYKVRLYGIDAPESKQDFGTRSKQNLSDLVFNRLVTLDIKSDDQYGRTVADVKISNHVNQTPQSVNLLQVKQGYAWVFREYLNKEDKHIYINAENHAKYNKLGLGLWKDKNPIKPSEFRKQNKKMNNFHQL